ncbi:YcjX family protein [Pasteurellaceae bacterium LIM206]|nr:YcjX family protein [Pasteurellaceae bacterium LIM206]
MFKTINREINSILDRGLDRSLRIAVTGLSRSGKTAFITSLINQLLYISRVEHSHLPLFEAARGGRIIGVRREPQLDLGVPRFDYESNLQDLTAEPPNWPQSTRNVSETRLAIRYQRHNGLLSYLKETGMLYVDIFDYPGEWLLDLPLLETDYAQWSQDLQSLMKNERRRLARAWLHSLTQLDLKAPANEDVLAQIAKEYTAYLQACKAEGLHFIQPGRFILPGELEGSPALQFFPLLHLTESQWQELKRQASAVSYFAVLQKRYEYYRNKVVKRFYRDYFIHFDRQVVLADCLTPLNHSAQAFSDMQEALRHLFKNFRYGKRTLLNRLFSPKIDKLMFVASKADHITSDQMPNLVSLMRQLVQEGGRHAEFEGIETEYSAVSAIRATRQVLVNRNGQSFKAIQGVRSSDKQLITVYPGSVPSKLPTPDFWQKQKFEFDQFEPCRLKQGEIVPHLRMDAVIQFLLNDKLL